MPKLFVANISFGSTDEAFAAQFQPYPEAESLSIMRNRATGGSRGFGFVTVGDTLADQLCKKEVVLTMDGRVLEFKPAVSREEMQGGAPGSAPPQPLKIFVAGVAYSTTDVAFRTYFEQFGELKDAVLMRNKQTGVSRGFGFVTFIHAVDVAKTIAPASLELDGRRLDVKPAVAREDMNRGGGGYNTMQMPMGGQGMGGYGQQMGGYGNMGGGYGQMNMGYNNMGGGYGGGYGQQQQGGYRGGGGGRGGSSGPEGSSKKIFVAGLAATTMTDDLRRYFEQYGAIVEAIVKTDMKTGASRGFGFVIFESSDSVDLALANTEHVIDNKNVDIKLAVPKHKMEGREYRGYHGTQQGGNQGGGGYANNQQLMQQQQMQQQMQQQAYGQQATYAYPQQIQQGVQQAFTGQEQAVYGQQAFAQPQVAYGGQQATQQDYMAAQQGMQAYGQQPMQGMYGAGTGVAASGRVEMGKQARAYHPYGGGRDRQQQY